MKYLLSSLAAFFLIFALFQTSTFIHRIGVPLLAEEDPVSCTPIAWPQKFRFLGQGHQVFAFESEDEQLVLKFFDREQLQDHWYDYLPFRASKKKDRRLKERIQIYPQSYRLAFEWLREETALLAVHQGTCNVQYPKIELIDSEARIFQIDLNKTPFILQKKVQSSLPALLQKAKEEGELTKLIDQFLAMHRQRISLQIADYDRNIRDNYGTDGKRLIYLDPARFHLDPNLVDPRVAHAEWLRVTDPVRKWLQKNQRHEVALFDIKIEQFLDWQRAKSYKGKNHVYRSRCWDFENCHYSFNHCSL